jgi:hypothetical protein
MNGVTPPPLPEPRPAALPQAADIKQREWLFRLVVGAGLLAALGLAWWTLSNVLLPIQKQSRDLGTAVSRLTTEVDALERKWTRADIERIRAAYNNVQSRLFADQAALEAWLGRLNDAAVLLGLDASVDFGKTTALTPVEQNLAIIPARISLEVRPRPNYTESPYQRLTRLARHLATESRRADLTEMTVVGGTNSVLSAVMILDLWAGEVEPAAELPPPSQPRESK